MRLLVIHAVLCEPLTLAFLPAFIDRTGRVIRWISERTVIMGTQLVSLAQEGRALYHSVWLRLRNNFWDPSRVDWSTWEHRFDGDIVDFVTAKERLRDLISALGDGYTKLVDKDPASSSESNDGNVVPNIATGKELDNNIGYLRIRSFDSMDAFEQVSAELAKIAHCDGFIIDLRGNSGGFVNPTAQCLELFLDEGHIATVEEQHLEGIKKDHFYLNANTFFRRIVRPDGTEEPISAGRAQCVTGRKPKVLLIDGQTASSAEMFAAALLANGEADGSCIAIGAQTFGKGIIQSTVEYQWCSLRYTSGRYLSASDEWFGDAQKVSNGVRPTMFVSTVTSRLPFKTAFDRLCQKLGKEVPRPELYPGENLFVLTVGAAFVVSTVAFAAMWRRR